MANGHTDVFDHDQICDGRPTSLQSRDRYSFARQITRRGKIRQFPIGPRKVSDEEHPSSSKKFDELRQDCLAFLKDLADPLTAVSNYAMVASRLHAADTSAARQKLGDILDKCRLEAERANASIVKLRARLNEK